MKRRILSIITALALCLSLCPSVALAADEEPNPNPDTQTTLDSAGGSEQTDGSEQTEDGPAPVEDGPAPAEDGPAPAEDGPAPAEDGPAPAEDGPAPAEDGPAPAEDGPAPAANDTSQTENSVASVDINGSTTYYDSITEAWTAAKGNTATVTLLKDVTISRALTVDGNDNITLDSSKNNEDRDFSVIFTGSNSQFIAFEVSGGTLTIAGGTITAASSRCKAIYVTGGELNVTGGTIASNGDSSSTVSIEGGVTNITGGTITAEGKWRNGVFVNWPDETTVVNISGSAVIRASGEWSEGVSVSYGKGTVTISGGTITATGTDSVGLSVADSQSVTLEGGTFRGDLYAISAFGTSVGGILGENKVYKSANASTYITDIDATEIEADVTVTTCNHNFNDSNVCVICGLKQVATVEIAGKPTSHISFRKAWQTAAAANTAAVITLLDNVAVMDFGESIKNSGGQITLNGNHHTLRTTSYIYNEKGTLTINNCVMEAVNEQAPTHTILIGGGDVTLTNCTVTSTLCAVEVSSGTLTINSGTYTATKPADAEGTGPYDKVVGLWVKYGTVQLRGGTFSGTDGAISTEMPELGPYAEDEGEETGLLLRDLLGHTETTRYAYFDENNTVITEGLDGQILTGTVTVKECTNHIYGQYTPVDSQNHRKFCAACGHDGGTEAHTLENNLCTICGYGATARVTAGGADTYYGDIVSAWQAAQTPQTATLTLLQNADITDVKQDMFTGTLLLPSGDVTLEMADGVALTSGGASSVIRVTGGTLTLKSGMVRNTNSSGMGLYAADGILNIAGGTVEAYNALNPYGGMTYITGGELTGTGGNGIGLFRKGSTGTVQISGGTFSGQQCAIKLGSTGGTVADLLAEGFSFARNGNPVSDATVTQLTGTVTVVQPPVIIIRHPVNVTQEYGYNNNLSIVTEPGEYEEMVSYQWYKVEADGSAAEVEDATSAYFTPDNNQYLDVGTYSYYCIVSYMGYTVQSRTAVFKVTPCKVTPKLTGTATKVYDSTTNVPEGHSLTVTTDDVSPGELVFSVTSYQYETPNAGERIAVTATGIAFDDTSGNYTLVSNSARARVGTITRADQATPNAPEAETVTATSITLKAVENAQYKRGDGSWQDSPEFTGLTPNTPYTFYIQLKEDTNHNASLVSAAASITTKKTMLDGAKVEVTGSYTYNGAAQVPAAENVTVTLNGVTVDPSQYSISATGNVNAGEAVLTVTAAENGNYSGSATGNFTIAQKALTVKANNQTITYGESIATTVDKVTPTGLVSSDTLESITLTASTANVPGGNITPSNAVIKRGGEDVTENYSITYQEGNLTINKANQTAPAAPSATDANITDTSITLDTVANAEYSKDGTNWQTSPEFPGLSRNTPYTFYVRLKEDANHNASPASAAASITTKKTMLDGAKVEVTGSYTYNGAAQVPAADKVTLTLNGSKIDPSQYSISATGNVNAGEAVLTVTATENGNYSGSATGKFVVGKASLTVTAKEQTITYGGSIATGTAQVTATGLCTGDALESVTLTPSTADVPGGTITPSGTVIKRSGEDVSANYNITYEAGALTITKSQPAIAFDENYTPSKTYDGQTIPNPTADNLTITGAKFGDVVFTWYKGSVTEANKLTATPKDAGTYTLTASIAETNNTKAAQATLNVTISPKTVSSPTIELSPGSFVYDGTEKKPAVTVKDGEKMIPADEYTVEYSNNTNVGTTATVTITDKTGGNYTVSGTKTFTITAKPLTGAKVEVTGPFTYTGSAQEPAPTVTLDGKTLTAGTDYTMAYTDNTNAGTATITVTGKGNYSGTAQGTFIIGRADLTVDGTGTASGTYGAKLSELTVSGLTAKLGATEISGTWKLTGDAVPNVGDSGEYTATFTPATGAGNYNALTAKVTLNIARADYSGTTTASTSGKYGREKTYDLSDLLPDGYKLGTPTKTDTNNIFDGDPIVNGAALTYKLADNAGVGKTGTITVPVMESTNYNQFDLTITVTVTDKIVPTLTITPISVPYTGSAVPAGAIQGTATADGKNIPGSWSFADGQALTNVADSGTKTVNFTPADEFKDDYAPATGTVVVTITKATPSLSLTPSPATLPSGGTVTLALSGLPDRGSATVTCSDENITVTEGSGSTWTADLPAGGASYTFTASYAGDGNHNGASATCTVSVEKIRPTLSLTANPASLRGGGTVTLTLSGLPAGGTAAVTCSGGITVTAGAGSTWTATLPNSTATYTFTASYAGNTSYHGASASCAVETTEVTVLPNPPEAGDGKQYQVIMEDGISEVPAGLQSIETLNTPEKLETAMKTAITQANSGVPQDNTAVYDVELQISTDGGATWTKATAANFPANGLTVTLPYPAGTNNSYTFTVVHMFTTSDFGKTPGHTETPTVTNTADGLQFTVTGLSPISVGWVQPSTPTTPTGPTGGGGGGGGGSSSAYAVTVERAEHGKVTSNRTNASSGSTVTLTATPDTGYVLDTLTVTDSRGNEIRLTAQGGGKYTFTMPGRAVTVKAAFAPLPEDTEKPCDGGADCPSHGFTDLGTVGTWYHEAVDYVLRNDLMGGYGNGLFGPDDTLTRAQFAQILFNKEGRPAVTGGGIFTDVAPVAWCAPAITWAAERGIVGGYGNGAFGPNDNITREQLAVMLWRYAGNPAATNKELHFNDTDEISPFALEALRWAVENGIINGYGNGRLGPQGQATRAQVAQILKNFLDNQK